MCCCGVAWCGAWRRCMAGDEGCWVVSGGWRGRRRRVASVYKCMSECGASFTHVLEHLALHFLVRIVASSATSLSLLSSLCWPHSVPAGGSQVEDVSRRVVFLVRHSIDSRLRFLAMQPCKRSGNAVVLQDSAWEEV